MKRIAILTPSMTTGDAVCNDVAGMYDVLKRRGYEVRIYASDWTLNEPKRWQVHKIKSFLVEPKVWPASRIKSFLVDPTDLLIYHFSMGWEPGIALLNELKCRRVIKYHNVTPPEFFAGWSPNHEAVCITGRAQLAALVRAECDVYLSDSGYNMRELISQGAAEERCRVVPPFHVIDHLQSLEPDFDVLDKYRDGVTNILMVGRVSPNKGHVSLIEAFATYHRDYNNKCRLLIVGKEHIELEAYSKLLRDTVVRFGLEDAVVFAGEVTDTALKSYFLVATVFLLTSEHEGFCVPLVEAMALKLPVVTYGGSAISETVGDAGLVWQERDPYLLAESIDVVVKDEQIGASLGLAGAQRYRQFFDNKKIEAQFLNALSGLL
ncbi:MAG: glycosyltransferase family 4 protein [bacterium]